MALTQWLTELDSRLPRSGPGFDCHAIQQNGFYLFAQVYKAVGRNGRVFAIPE